MNGLIPDNWIYIQENDVKVGRIQFFNNWSPYLVKDMEKVWIGMEYFTADGDVLWNMSDDRLSALGAAEAQKLGFIEKDDIIDSVVVRSPKAYPAYFGTFGDFDRIRSFTDGFEDLFLIGRNGMHRYNNQDHSMLSAMVAVDNVVRGSVSKDNIWAINTEKEYHEKE
jgi:protoporphyrinogen oxidase